jgi:hypothetical protein
MLLGEHQFGQAAHRDEAGTLDAEVRNTASALSTRLESQSGRRL